MPKISPAAYDNWASSHTTETRHRHIDDHVAGLDSEIPGRLEPAYEPNDRDGQAVRFSDRSQQWDLVNSFKANNSKLLAQFNNKVTAFSHPRDQGGNFGKRNKTMFFKKLFLLLWKNWIIRWRHPVLFFVEIGAVGLFFGILLVVKLQLASNAGSVLESNATIYSSWTESNILDAFRYGSIGSSGRSTVGRKLLAVNSTDNSKTTPILMYSPNTSSEVVAIMEKFRALTSDILTLDIQGYPTESALVKAVDGLSLITASLNMRGAVVFDAGTISSSGKKKFPYKIRLKDFTVPTQMLFFPVSLPGPGNTPNDYTSRFNPLQYLVDASILSWVCDQSGMTTSCNQQTTSTIAPTTTTPSSIFTRQPIMRDFKIELQAYPYPPYTEALQEFLSFLFGLMLPQFTVYAFLFLIPIIHMGVVKEKQSGVKELMKMMGMSRLLYWMSWLMSCVVSSIVPIIIVIVVCVAGSSVGGGGVSGAGS